MSNFLIKILLLHWTIWVFNSGSVIAQPATHKIAVPKIPLSVKFAEEEVPLSDPIVYDQLEKELIKNSYKHSSTLLILKRILRYREKILSILVENKIPKDFLYLAVIESELSPYANSNEAVGFWQFKKTTAEEYNLEISNYIDQRRDITLSTQAACKMLNQLNKTFNNWTLTAAAYNGGRKTIVSNMKLQNVQSYYKLYLTPETYDYIFRIIAIKLICENPENYDFIVDKPEYSDLTEEVEVNKDINLIDFAKKYNINYTTLKYYNPWLLYNPTKQKEDKYYEENKEMNVMFEVRPGKTYTFLIPKLTRP